MNTEIQREEELFDAARKLTDPAACRAFLDRACAGDPALRARLEGLLVTEQDAEKFFAESGSAMSLRAASLQFSRGTSSSAGASSAPVPGEEPVGTRIGRYKLVQKIG